MTEEQQKRCEAAFEEWCRSEREKGEEGHEATSYSLLRLGFRAAFEAFEYRHDGLLKEIVRLKRVNSSLVENCNIVEEKVAEAYARIEELETQLLKARDSETLLTARIPQLEAIVERVKRERTEWMNRCFKAREAAMANLTDKRVPKIINIKCETECDGLKATTILPVVRVEEEGDGSFTAVTSYWPKF